MSGIHQLVRGEGVFGLRTRKIDLEHGVIALVCLVLGRDANGINPDLCWLDIGHEEAVGGGAGDRIAVKIPLIEQLRVGVVAIDLAITTDAGAESGKGGVLTGRNGLAGGLGEENRKQVRRVFLLPGQNNIATGTAEAINGDLILGVLERIEAKFAGVKATAIIIAI